MKKILCALLCLLMVVTLISCGKKEEPQKLKLGLGTYTDVSATDATEDANGKASATTTIAALTVDAEGKVVACVLDSADATVEYTAAGKAVANDSFKTKNELGTDYGMSTNQYAQDINKDGVVKEWNEQAKAFASLVVGKKLDEIKALVAEGDRGNADVMSAGCTITVSEFVYAIEDAFKNLTDSEATANDTLKLGVSTEQTCTDATEEKNGSNELETTFFAAAVNADSKIVAAYSDCVAVSFTFDAEGKSTFDTTKAITTKRTAGTAYGMSTNPYAQDLNSDGVVKEWNEQAAAFDAKCIGKTAAEVASLKNENGYGNSDVQSAGCTIIVDGFVKAASKIG